MTIPPVDPAQRFAANMRRLRGARGHSQEGFALLANIHRTEVTKLESGKRDPKLGTIVKIARGLDVSLSELLDGIDEGVEPSAT
jgi:transcriptional regulator with XRE-family HTH domain